MLAIVSPSPLSLQRTVVGCAVVLAAAAARGQLPDDPTAARIVEASARGRAWLVAAQAADGSWGSGGFRGSVAVTAQALMALVAAGSTPDAGPDAASVARGLDMLVAAADDDGLIAGQEQAAHGPMYGHAYATLALAEMFGETRRDDEIAGILVRSRDLIERTQNDDGGWRYQPRKGDADASVTAAMVIALRGLNDAGFTVSQPCLDRAVAYLERLQNDDGGFRYLAAPGRAAAPRSAAALVALLVVDGKGPVIDRGFAWLADHPITLESADGYAMYGFAHAATAHWLRGPEAWAAWQAAPVAALLAAQRPDGSWADPSCAEYGTSAALTVLQMPFALAPLWRRPQPVATRPEAPR
jgi:hypothetical protein